MELARLETKRDGTSPVVIVDWGVHLDVSYARHFLPL